MNGCMLAEHCFPAALVHECAVTSGVTYSIQWCALAKTVMSTLQTSTAPLILDSDTIFLTYMEIFVSPQTCYPCDYFPKIPMPNFG